MDVNELAMIRRRAVQRVLLRRRKPTVRVQCGRTPDTDLTVSEVIGSEFLPATTLDEFIDDQLAVYAQPRGEFTAVLVEVLEAARGSEKAALAALTGARMLAEWDQFHLYADLEQMRQKAVLPAARKLTAAITARWERLRLPDSRPDYPETGDLPDPPEVDRYARPKPAGRLPWLTA